MSKIKIGVLGGIGPEATGMFYLKLIKKMQADGLISCNGDFPQILKGIADDFGIAWEEQKRRMVKAYDYTDAEGNLLFQVCRMDPKDFCQRRPDGSGGWIWDLKKCKVRW